jgi:hypothetical protein
MRIVRRAAAAASLILLSAAGASAQQGGVEVGVIGSYITAAKGTPRQIGTGITGGFFVEAPLFGGIRIHPGIHYAQRKSKLAFGADPAALTDIRIDYISVPLLVRMPLFWRLYVTEGASFHFPVRATQTRPGQAAEDVLDNIRAPDVSMVMGLGVRMGTVGLEGRWDSGFFTVQENQDPSEFPSRNRALSALLVIGL